MESMHYINWQRKLQEPREFTEETGKGHRKPEQAEVNRNWQWKAEARSETGNQEQDEEERTEPSLNDRWKQEMIHRNQKGSKKLIDENRK